MVKTSSQTQISFSLDNEHELLLQELDCYEASVITGGFSLQNQTDQQIKFYPFSDALAPTPQTLAPNASGNYTGTHVLYDADPGTPFDPVVRPIGDNNGQYRFSIQNGKRELLGAAFFKAPFSP